MRRSFPPSHLLRNVFFSKRSPAEMLEQREYWNPWISMQALSHASMAILNHPFIHLLVLRGDNSVLPQSRLLLQQTVNRHCFTSEWVFRRIQTCEDLGFEIKDPLIGHLVTATATISWIFQFAKDNRVCRRAREDLRKFERLLSRMSNTRPHISQKVYI